MNVTRDVWLELTKDERMVCLRYAASENAKRWEMKNSFLRGRSPGSCKSNHI